MAVRLDIRPLIAADSLDELTALLHAAYATLAQQGWNFTAADQSVEVTRQRLTDAQCYVAVSEGHFIGTVAVRGPKSADDSYLSDVSSRLYTTPGTALVSQFAVHPSWRGQGLGERLMDAAEAWALSHRFCRVALDTAAPAAALRERYRRRGYTEVGEVQWTGKTYRSVLMLKLLDTLTAPEVAKTYTSCAPISISTTG